MPRPRNRINPLGEGRRSFPSSGLVRLAVLAMPALLLCACGLETVSYYSPPTLSWDGSILVLTHSTANTDVTFRGYDVYYRAYADETRAKTDRESIETALGLSTSTPEGMRAKITGLSFRPIYLASDKMNEPSPLFVESSNKAVQYSITFTSGDRTKNWFYTSTVDGVPTQGPDLIRSTMKDIEVQNSFNFTYSVGDKDYDGTGGVLSVNTSPGSTIHFVFFAIGYGFDPVKLTDIYSLPAALYKNIDYPIPQ